MIKKQIFRVIVILLIFLGLIWLCLYELFREGNRDLGVLTHPCNKEYSIKISHYAEFHWAQPLYFVILKNKKEYKNYKGSFESTNDKYEKINSFEIHCYDNLIYVTWKGENIPVIILDTKTDKLYHNSGDEKYRKELYDKIKKGNPHLRWGGEVIIQNLINQCNKDYSITLSYLSDNVESRVFFRLMKKDSLIDGYTIDVMYNEEKPVEFDGFCYENIYYITKKNENVPLIMFDSKNDLLSFKSTGEELHPNYMKLFYRLKVGNSKLEIKV